MGLSVWRETSKKLTVYRVCYTPIETLFWAPHVIAVAVVAHQGNLLTQYNVNFVSFLSGADADCILSSRDSIYGAVT